MQPKPWLMWGTVACIALAAFAVFGNDDIRRGDEAMALIAMSIALSLAWALLVLLIWGVRSVQKRAAESRPRH